MAVSELTKDCDRDDCSISDDENMTSTLLAWTPTYDKHGNRSGGDPNISTSSMRCFTCGRSWTLRTQHGETSVTAHPPIET